MQTDKRIYLITDASIKEAKSFLPYLVRSKEDIFTLINKIFPNLDNLKIETKLNTIIVNDDIQLIINRIVPIATELDLNMLLE